MKQEVLYIEIKRSLFDSKLFKYREGDISSSIGKSNASLEEILNEIKDKMKELGK